MATEQTFGLEGSFPGDHAKLAKSQEVAKRLLQNGSQFTVQGSGSNSVVTLEEIIDILSSLPWNGRVTFTRGVILASSHKTEIINALFNKCFSTEQDSQIAVDEDFVLVCNRDNSGVSDTSTQALASLNTKYYHLLKLVIIVAPSMGKAGTDLLFQCLESTSNLFRKEFLGRMVSSKDLSDDELLSIYKAAANDGRAAIITAAKAQKDGSRAKFMERLYVEELYSDVDILLWVGGASFKKYYIVQSKEPFLRWSQHGDAYIGHLKELFESCGKDLLAKYTVFQKWNNRLCTSDFGSAHAIRIVELIIEHKPCRLRPNVLTGNNSKLKEYLTKLSKIGELDPTEWEDVELYLPPAGPKQREGFISASLSLADRAAFLNKYAQKELNGPNAQVWKPIIEEYILRSTWHNSRQSLDAVIELMGEVFESISFSTFWAMIDPKGTYTKTSNVDTLEGSMLFKIFEEFFKKYLCRDSMGKNHVGRDRVMTAIQMWVKLHDKMVPSKLEKVFAELGATESAMREMWAAWKLSYATQVNDVALTLIASIHRHAYSTDLSTSRNFVTLDCRMLVQVIDVLAHGMDTSTVTAKCYVQLVSGVVEHYRLSDPKIECDAIKRLNDKLTGIILNKVIPEIEAKLTSNPADPDYITSAEVSKYVDILNTFRREWFVTQKPIRDALWALFKTLLKTGPGEDVICYKNQITGKMEFRKNCIDMIKTISPYLQPILKAAIEHKDKDVAQYWKDYKELVLNAKPKEFANTDKKDLTRMELFKKLENTREYPLREYVDIVELLPKDLKAEEMDVLEGMARTACCSRKNNQRCHYINEMCALFNKADIAEKFYSTLDDRGKAQYLQCNSNVSVDFIRKNMEKEAQGKSADDRMSAHTSLINGSLNANHDLPIKETTKTLDFVAKKIKNESGLSRPTVYSTISNKIIQIVERSFEELAKTQDEDVIVQATKQVRSLQQMLQDDMSKRDTVAKREFKDMARTIYQRALWAEGVGENMMKLREAWILGAMKIEWLVVEATVGEQGLHGYVPKLADIRHGYKENQGKQEWVDADVITKVYQPAMKAFACGDAWKKLEKSRCESVPDPKTLIPSPKELVELMDSCLEKVKMDFFANRKDDDIPEWRDSPFTTSKTLVDGMWFPEDGTYDALFHRMVQIVKGIAHVRWYECPTIVDMVESITKGLAHPKCPWLHAERSLEIQKALLKVHRRCRNWWAFPPLAALTEALFKAFSDKCQADSKYAKDGGLTQLESLEELWWDMNSCLEFRKATSEIKSARALTFFVEKFTVDVELLAKQQKKKTYAQKRLECASRALAISPLAIRDHDVLEALYRSRDDQLGLVLNAQPAVTSVIGTDFRDHLLDDLNAKRLKKMVSSQAQLYSATCIDHAMSRKNTMSKRSQMMTSYVCCPATSYADLVMQLQNLCGDEAGEADDAPYLIESLILSMFQTDSAWHILSYLLSPEVVSRKGNRTTGTILENVCKHIHENKVVKILGILLSSERRWALQVYLHRIIIRALANIDSPESAELIRREWSYGKPKKSEESGAPKSKPKPQGKKSRNDGPTPEQQKWLEDVKQTLQGLANGTTESPYHFPASLNSWERREVHRMADDAGLCHISMGADNERHIVCSTTQLEDTKGEPQIHKDVRAEIVIALKSYVEKEGPLSDLLWEVYESLAEDCNDNPMELTLHLFSLYWEFPWEQAGYDKREDMIRASVIRDAHCPPTLSATLQNLGIANEFKATAMNNIINEMKKILAQPFKPKATRNRYRTVLEKLYRLITNPNVKVVTSWKLHLLSDATIGIYDQKCLDALSARILESMQLVEDADDDREDYYRDWFDLDANVRIYSLLVTQVLSREINNSDQTQSVMANHKCAKHFGGTFGPALNVLLNTPPNKPRTRKRALAVCHGLESNIPDNKRKIAKYAYYLINVPYKQELALLAGTLDDLSQMTCLRS